MWAIEVSELLGRDVFSYPLMLATTRPEVLCSSRSASQRVQSGAMSWQFLNVYVTYAVLISAGFTFWNDVNSTSWLNQPPCETLRAHPGSPGTV